MSKYQYQNWIFLLQSIIHIARIIHVF